MKRDSAPRMNTLVALPTPPLREISMPGRRASTSATPVAPLRSMVLRSMTETSPTRSDSACGVRLAVTTVSSSMADAVAAACACAASGTRARPPKAEARASVSGRHAGRLRRTLARPLERETQEIMG
ncbi:hypothetical protein D3C72_1597420 [compost metagenome]